MSTAPETRSTASVDALSRTSTSGFSELKRASRGISHWVAKLGVECTVRMSIFSVRPSSRVANSMREKAADTSSA